ncbi:peptidyl-prolyl cis-trans isomerase [Bacillus sp. FJAT-49736]|uniref:peptidyl-prolyl cis-trans isomerase n=1 Tax=Bacillus sp. FJAT-49736 TaxID=2833582 RepID=UPI001BC9D01A|nr:peptidyl-prolyl cis-trans isomerase [Bacillus sp. FJAT-49736]MBS4172380.1 peptidyl-prolyl cis-trans isomerase [Bacillus sp. FJAT-49736]
MIIPFKGKVKFPITLDAGVWIFDDRKIDLNTYFDAKQEESDELEIYKNKMAETFNRGLKEGAAPPPATKPKRYLKEILLTGTFGMKLEPFIKNAEPFGTQFVIETSDGDVSIPLEEAYTLIAAFSKEGKPLKEDGPIHILYEDGSNKDNPIKHVKAFRIE